MKVSPYDSGSLASLPLSGYIYRPVALGYDVVEDRVYWTDVTRNTISRSFLNGSMQEIIFYQNVQTPDGLAVDPVGRNLYWTDTGTNKLEVSKLDGSYRKALIASGLDEPRDIILDVRQGSVIFMTEYYKQKLHEISPWFAALQCLDKRSFLCNDVYSYKRTNYWKTLKIAFAICNSVCCKSLKLHLSL